MSCPTCFQLSRRIRELERIIEIQVEAPRPNPANAWPKELKKECEWCDGMQDIIRKLQFNIEELNEELAAADRTIRELRHPPPAPIRPSPKINYPIPGVRSMWLKWENGPEEIFQRVFSEAVGFAHSHDRYLENSIAIALDTPEIVITPITGRMAKGSHKTHPYLDWL